MLRFSASHPSISTRSRLAAVATGVVLVAGPVIGFADPAAALPEPPSNAAGTIEFDCGPDGGVVLVTGTNVDGLSRAIVTTFVNGAQRGYSSLDPNETYVDVYGGLDDNQVYIVTVTGNNGFSTTTTLGPVNCFEYHGEIEAYCLDGQPLLRAQADQYQNPTTVYFDLDGVTQSATVTDTNTWPAQLTDGVPYSATLRTDEDGVFAHLDGVLDCSTVVTIPTTIPGSIPPSIPATIPAGAPEAPSSTPSATPSNTSPANTVPAAIIAAQTPAPAVVAPTRPLATHLPATGTDNGVLGICATMILVAGAALRRLASRSPR